jgi:hypothetical protein
MKRALYLLRSQLVSGPSIMREITLHPSSTMPQKKKDNRNLSCKIKQVVFFCFFYYGDEMFLTHNFTISD